jgi:hypothetical protein
MINDRYDGFFGRHIQKDGVAREYTRINRADETKAKRIRIQSSAGMG